MCVGVCVCVCELVHVLDCTCTRTCVVCSCVVCDCGWPHVLSSVNKTIFFVFAQVSPFEVAGQVELVGWFLWFQTD